MTGMRGVFPMKQLITVLVMLAYLLAAFLLELCVLSMLIWHYDCRPLDALLYALALAAALAVHYTTLYFLDYKRHKLCPWYFSILYGFDIVLVCLNVIVIYLGIHTWYAPFSAALTAMSLIGARIAWHTIMRE